MSGGEEKKETMDTIFCSHSWKFRRGEKRRTMLFCEKCGKEIFFVAAGG